MSEAMAKSPLRTLTFITFATTVVDVLVMRGIFFYTHELMQFGSNGNLAVSAALMGCYFVGCQLTGITYRIAPARTLLATLMTIKLLGLVLITAWPQPWLVITGTLLLVLVTGIMWPLIIAYVGAGQVPREASHSIGNYNVAWILAGPVAMFVTGPLLVWWAPGFFLVSAVLSLIVLLSLVRLPRTPAEPMPHDHPGRLSVDLRCRYIVLMRSSRRTLILCSALSATLAPLVPSVLSDLGLTVQWATALAAMAEGSGLIAFLIMQRTTSWHGSSVLAAYAAVAPALGVGMVLFAASLSALLAGWIMFQTSFAIVHMTSLFYGIVARETGIDVARNHESAVAIGGMIGPGIVLILNFIVASTPMSTPSMIRS